MGLPLPFKRSATMESARLECLCAVLAVDNDVNNDLLSKIASKTQQSKCHDPICRDVQIPAAYAEQRTFQ